MVNALEFIPKSKQAIFSKAFDREDRLHVIQLLSDLKYLNYNDFVAQEVPLKKLENAVAQFRIEYKELLTAKESWSNFLTVYNSITAENISYNNTLTAKEIDLLEIITSLEGAFEIKHIPLGVKTLLSRVCLFRYKIFGFKNVPQGNALVSEKVVTTLSEMVQSIGYSGSWIKFANILGNQVQLTSFCKELYTRQDSQFNAIVFFKINRKNVRQFRNSNFLISNKKRFEEKLPKDQHHGTIETLINSNKNSNSELNLKVASTENTFLLRVIQVKLWISGLYEGHLDNDFGPLTYEALKEYLEYYVDNERRPKKELARVLFLLKSNHGLFNLVYFFNAYLNKEERTPIEKEHTSVSNLYNFVINNKSVVKGGYQSKKTTTKIDPDKLNRTLAKNINNYALHGIGLKNRRQYKGKQRFLRFFSRVYDLMIKGVNFLKKIILKLIRVIAKSIKIIFYEIAEGVKNFKKGINFLFGKRITNTENVVETDFDFDFDGITTVNYGASDNQLLVHSKHLSDNAAAIYPTLNFTRIVIEWGIKLANGTAWTSILIGIAKLFKDFLKHTLLQHSSYLKPKVFFSS